MLYPSLGLCLQEATFQHMRCVNLTLFKSTRKWEWQNIESWTLKKSVLFLHTSAFCFPTPTVWEPGTDNIKLCHLVCTLRDIFFSFFVFWFWYLTTTGRENSGHQMHATATFCKNEKSLIRFELFFTMLSFPSSKLSNKLSNKMQKNSVATTFAFLSISHYQWLYCYVIRLACVNLALWLVHWYLVTQILPSDWLGPIPTPFTTYLVNHNKQRHRKVLLNSCHLNSHTLAFHSFKGSHLNLWER